MKQKWIPVALFGTLGLLSALTIGAVSIANKVDYEVLSYSVLLLDNQGITFRLMFGVTNPSRFNLDVWEQRYDVLVAGYKISEITAKTRFKLLANNMSIIPLDISFKWVDLEQKIQPLYSQSSTTAIGDLPVLIKGKLAAKIGILQITRIPFRATMRLSDFLP